MDVKVTRTYRGWSKGVVTHYNSIMSRVARINATSAGLVTNYNDPEHQLYLLDEMISQINALKKVMADEGIILKKFSWED